jgi:hypothetical protein
LKYKLIIYDNESKKEVLSMLIEANELYEAAKMADEMYKKLDIKEKDTTMELVEKDAW